MGFQWQMERSILLQDHHNHNYAIQQVLFHNKAQHYISKTLEFHKRTDMNFNRKKHSNNALRGLSKSRKLHQDLLLVILVYASKTQISTVDSKRNIMLGILWCRGRLQSDQMGNLFRVKARVRCVCFRTKTVTMKMLLLLRVEILQAITIHQWKASSAHMVVKQTQQIDY